MKVLIVYSSAYGNTEAVARAMGAALAPGTVAEVRRAREAEAVGRSDLDLLLVGAPTQQRGVPTRIGVRDYVEHLADRGFAGCPAAAFDTRLDVPEYQGGSAARWIEQTLAGAGCRIVVPYESFLVEGYRGPLVPGELQRAAVWAKSVLDITLALETPPAPAPE